MRNDNFDRNSNRGTFGQFSSNRGQMNSGNGGGGSGNGGGGSGNGGGGNFASGYNNNYNNGGNRMPPFFAQKTQRQAQDRNRRPQNYDDFPEVPSSSSGT